MAELDCDFINRAIYRLPQSTHQRKVKKRRDKQQEHSFFHFFMEETLTMFTPVPRSDEIAARTRVAESLASGKVQLKACGIKAVLNAADLLEMKPTTLPMIHAISALHGASYIILIGKVAISMVWGEDTPIVLEKKGRDRYTRSQLSVDYIKDNYVMTSDPMKPIKVISKYSAVELREVYGKTEQPMPETTNKRGIYDALSAYISRTVN